MQLISKHIDTDGNTLGRLGEDISVKYLVQNNYTILEKNFSCKLGEIDIIAQDETGRIIFVEIKTRTDSNFGFGRESITKEKIRRIRLTSEFYLKRNKKLLNFPIRYDCIEITNGDVVHLKSIF